MRSPTPVGVIRSSARTAPVSPWARPRRKPAKIRPLAAGRMILKIFWARRRHEGRAHLQQARVDVADAGIGVEHDDRRRHDHHRDHLGAETDAVDEGDQRDDRGHRRRLRDHPDRQGQPFEPARQAHREAEPDAEDAAQADAHDHRLQRLAIGPEQAAVGHHPEQRAMRLGEGREGRAHRQPPGPLPQAQHEQDRERAYDPGPAEDAEPGPDRSDRQLGANRRARDRRLVGHARLPPLVGSGDSFPPPARVDGSGPQARSSIGRGHRP